MLSSMLTRGAISVTLAISVVTELSAFNDSGTSAIVCLVVGANVALLSGYCRACYLKSTPRNHRRKYVVNSMVDTCDIFHFYHSIKEDCSSTSLFLIAWMEFLLQTTLLCIIIKVIKTIIIDLIDDQILSKIDQLTKYPLPWSNEGTDLVAGIIFVITFITTVILMKLMDCLNKKCADCSSYLNCILKTIIIIILMSKIIAIVVIYKPYFRFEQLKTWLLFENSHPKGVTGIMLSTSGFLLAYSLWTSHTKDDYRRISATLPFIGTFLLNLAVLILFGCSMVISVYASKDLEPVSMYIMDINNIYWAKSMIGLIDVVLMIFVSFSVLPNIFRSVLLVSSKLGRCIRKDAATIEIRPSIYIKVVWFLFFSISISSMILCNFEQLMCTAQSYALFLSSVIFVLTMKRTYKSVSKPQYSLLCQDEQLSRALPSGVAKNRKNNKAGASMSKSESSSESETDVDDIVEEYKNKLKVESFEDIQETRASIEPNVRSFTIIRVVVNVLVGLSLLLSTVIIYVSKTNVVMGLSIAYVIIAFSLFVLAIKQPMNDSFNPRLPLMPLFPLLGLNICVFLQPFCLHFTWPIVLSSTFSGLVFYTISLCCRKVRITDDEYNEESHQQSICLQPLPSQSTSLRTSVLPAHSSVDKPKKHKVRRYTTDLKTMDAAVT